MKISISKKILIGVGVIFGILILIFIGKEVRNYYYQYLAEKYQKEYERIYAQEKAKDNVGGKTPKECYEKFVEALKNENIELASQFYARDEDKEKARKRFLEMKKKGELKKWAESLPDWSQMREEESWGEDLKRYSWVEYLEREKTVYLPLGEGKYQKETIPPGEYKNFISFWYNKYARVWKIYNF